MDADRPKFTEQMQRSSGAYELVLSAVILGLFGLWLDSRFDTTPLLAIVFTVLGLIGAAASIYYRYVNEIAQIQAETESLRSQTGSTSTEEQP